jgi:hypothetical protein
MLAVVVVAGCQGAIDPAGAARLHDQAKAELASWADAVKAAGGPSPVVPVGDLTGQVGVWEEALGSDGKIALMAGAVESVAALSSGTPPAGKVTWGDGTTASVPVLSAGDALTGIRSVGGSCSDCTPLRVTGARLINGTFGTSRGDAIGPMWEFTLQGTAVKITRVAVANAVVVAPLAGGGGNPSIEANIDSAIVSASGLELTVSFVGAPLPGDRDCGEDYTAEGVESDLAVVVIVLRHSHPMIGACSSVGARRTAVATLAAPLGTRAVLDVEQGLPVPVSLTT